MPTTNLEIAKSYLMAIESGQHLDELADFFTDDAEQEEFPNRINPKGIRRTKREILDGAARGRQVLSRQRFEILNSIESGDRLALEILWVGVLAVPTQELAVGAEMRARFAVFLVIRDGKIARQHNYDCHDP